MNRGSRLFVCAWLLLIAAPAPAQVDTKVAAWVEQVVLGPEFGDSKVCTRWTRSPSLSVFNGSPAQVQAVTDALTEINDALAGTSIKKIRLLPPRDSKADICLIYAPLDEFPSIGKKLGFRYVEGNWGFFHLNWNGKFELTKAYVLIAKDKLEGDRLRHFLLEEITQALGPASDSAAFPDSIFFQNGADGGKAIKINDLDRKLLRFFYNRLQPGHKADDVRAALRSYWEKS